MSDNKNLKVLNITILDGDGSESGPFMEAVHKTNLNQEYFILISVKPFKFVTRQDFAQMMEIAMKGLKGELVPQNVSQPGPTKELHEE